MVTIGLPPPASPYSVQLRVLADRLAQLRQDVVPGSRLHRDISDISVEVHRIARALRDEEDAVERLR